MVGPQKSPRRAVPRGPPSYSFSSQCHSWTPAFNTEAMEDISDSLHSVHTTVLSPAIRNAADDIILVGVTTTIAY